ncbi:MAG: cyclic nucleotide-binding domain-containing protein [Methylacidiphilales bacterium]|nr:cyclic nucleotide-binding domain-containing protein [Candidatus Methylacidiphilales bacterium]
MRLLFEKMITTTPALFNALAAIPVLAGTDLAAQTLLAQEGLVHDFAPGAWIVREGDEGHSLFILVEGEVEVIKRAGSPHEVTLATLPRGTFFGEMCVVDPVPRAASVRALSPVRVIEIKAATLHHLYQKMPGQYAIVLLNVARDMARRLRVLDEAFAARAS